VDCFSQTTCTEAEAGGGTHWTTDSRASWHGVTKATWPDGSQSGNRLLGVACPTSTICVFATGRSGIARLTMTSSTAGTLQQILPSKRGDDLNDIACRSATRCLAVGDRGQILSTSDGANWVSERHGSTAQIRAMSCDADGCVAVGDQGSMQTASATGDDWTTRDSGAPSFPSTPTLFGVSCEALNCLAIGSGGTALRSTDAGHTWAPRPTGATEDLHGIACASALTCIAVAGYGRILRTTDFGDTWSSSSPTADTLNGVGCSPTGSTCAAVGSFGTLLVSPDRGATWQRRDSDTLGYLGAATCTTDDVCLVVGQSGLVLRSIDGGQTWTRRLTGVDDDFGAISCFDAERCAAAGSAGTILRTFDAGATWSPVGTGTRRLLSSVACISATSCLAGGEGGAEIEAAAQSPPVPDLAVADAVAREGYGPNPKLRFAISLNAPTTVPVVAHYASSDGTATTADRDYAITAGDLVIQPGQMSTVVDVAIVDDQRNEPDETMRLTLSAPGNARLQDRSATGTIIDDDPPLVVTPPTETTTTPPPTETTPTTTTPPPTETTQTTTPASAPPPADTTPTDPPADSGVTAPPKEVQRAPASTCTVPVLTGHSLGYAIKRLHRWHCALADVVQRFGRGPVGLVVAQRPRSGTTVKRRRGVVLVVSAGRGETRPRRYAL
ncbi:MAG: hypothetical protein QOJ29_3276, partial [Thermoleophilaceae bacterium]|nr:hypothetical protein [Thermoleophilaceae bacterium]